MKTVQQHQGYFLYKTQPIEYSFWSNLSVNQKPDVAVLLGAGQTSSIPRMVAERAGVGVVVIGGVPHWHASPDAEDIEDFTKLYFESAYSQVLTTFHNKSMHLLAESQAAPAALVIASGSRGTVKNVCLVRPLGFSVQAFGNTSEARLKTFRKRILRTFLQYTQSFMYDPRNVTAILILFRAMLREPTLRALNKKYAAGIAYDALPDLQRAADVLHKAGNTISIILGGKDKMFPPHEIITAVDGLLIPHVHISVIPSASHSSLATRAGKEILSISLGVVRKATDKPLAGRE